MILNIQPVISTLGAFLLFGDRLTPRFFLYAGIAIVAGIFLSVEHPTLIGVSFAQAGLNLGTGYALVCALFWGLSTVAGRGVMIGIPLRLAASLRIVVGLVCMTVILLVYGNPTAPRSGRPRPRHIPAQQSSRSFCSPRSPAAFRSSFTLKDCDSLAPRPPATLK